MTLGISNESWQALSTMISAAALIVNAAMAVTIFISVRSLREAVSAKESSILTWSVERIAEIRPLMNEIRDSRGDKVWMKRHHDEVMTVLDTLQIISFMALEGVIDRDRIASMWGKSFSEQWRSMADYVGDFRETIGEQRTSEKGAFFARSFEQFATYCRGYLIQHFNVDVEGGGRVQ